MADCILMQAGGGGLDPDELTATAGDVLKGKIAGVAGNDDPVAGTLELTGTAADSQVLNGQTYYNTDAKTKRTGTQINRGAWTGSVGMNGSVTVPAGFHNGGGAVSGPAVTQRGAWTSSVGRNGRVTVPEGYHNGAGYVNGPAVTERGAWAGSVAMNSSVMVPEGYHNGAGRVNGPTIITMNGFTIMPTAQTQTFQTANKYMNGNITCAAAPVLPPSVVKKGYTYKVGDTTYVGTFEGSADDKFYIFNDEDSRTYSNLGDFRFTSSNKTNMAQINVGYSFDMSGAGSIISPKQFIRVSGKSQDYNTWGLGVSKLTTKLNNRRTVVVRYSTNNLVNKAYFGFSKNGALTISSADASPNLDAKYNLPGNSTGTATLDISKLMGDYYFYVFMQPVSDFNGNYANFDVHSICAVV